MGSLWIILTYKNTLKQISTSIQENIGKFKNTVEIPIYKVGNLDDGLNVFYINPDNALKHAQERETNLYKIVFLQYWLK